MENYNLDKYFGTTNKGELAYYSPRALIVILEGEMGKCFDDIKKFAENASISITSGQIVEFLNKTFEQEKPELKAKIDNCKKVVSNGEILFGEEQIEYLKNSSEEFDDSISASKYAFTPYSLEYFKQYTSILKSKLFLLLNIIESISNNKSNLVSEQLSNLDINLDSNGDILKEDIIRLILPTIYNLTELEAIVSEGNKAETYLEFKLSKLNLYKRGISVGGLYPSLSIQVKNIDGNHSLGNVPLSKNQKNELNNSLSKSMKKTAKLIVDLFD
ncbi:MAG: hypothetical protein HFI86_08970 [Bacilli bacterium]|nr:hypothetical protein [Bacilli bacterium]